MEQITFIVPGDPNQLTGGYLYDAKMVGQIRASGKMVDVIGLPGRFPMPDSIAQDAMAKTLLGLGPNALVIIDGLALGGLGDVVQRTLSQASDEAPRMVALVHHPLADERGLDAHEKAFLHQQERIALSCAERVITTSAFTAHRLIELGLVEHMPLVVTPGVEPAPLAKSASMDGDLGPPHRMLCVASLTPRKGHEVLLEALHALQALPWMCQWVGDPYRNRAHADKLMARIEALSLDRRVECLGELDSDRLGKAYADADLCVLPSWYEGYGMVVTEAIARGIPVVATDGGALPDTLPSGAGTIVPAGDAKALAEALATWCQDASLRRAWKDSALAARANLNDWPKAGQRFIAALGLSTLNPRGANGGDIVC